MESTSSPVPVKEHKDFFEALKAVVMGSKITKAEWNNEDIYGFLANEILNLHLKDGTDTRWIISEGDLKGTDWLIL